jgi:hypothetical protein
VYFHGARGCAGEEFIKDHKHAPLQLSKPDYEKWEKQGFRPGDHVVIIGGKSRSSVIFSVESWQATVVGHSLTGEGGARQAALDYLEGEGYDTGKAGRSKKGSEINQTETQEDTTPNQSSGYSFKTPVQNPITPAARLQQRAEQNGIETLSHPERRRVAFRLLKWGWEPAWEWFNQQFGNNFDPSITWVQFRSVTTSFPEEYAHVEVPAKPR